MGKYLQETDTSCCFLSDLTDYAFYLFIYFPIIFTQLIYKKLFGDIFYLNFKFSDFLFYRPTSPKATKGILRSCYPTLFYISSQTFEKLACHTKLYAKYGGERGIRTLDAPFETYMISNHAPSTTQTPLRDCKVYSWASNCCNAISTSLGVSSTTGSLTPFLVI
jgi:hypothetical protein